MTTLEHCKNYSADTGEEGKKGKINFRPGIEPGTQRLGAQYTRHQAITQDKSLSPHSFLCTTSGRWRICQPHTGRPPKPFPSNVFDARTEVYLSFFTCVSRVILTIPSAGELRLQNTRALCNNSSIDIKVWGNQTQPSLLSPYSP